MYFYRTGSTDEFFRQPPLSTLSGAFYPIEGMLHLLQRLTVLNPCLSLRGYLARGAAEGQWNVGAVAQFSSAVR